MKEKLRAEIVGFLATKLPVDYNALHRFTILYDPGSFEVRDITSTLHDFIEPVADTASPARTRSFNHRELELAEPGRIIYRWFPGRYAHSQDNKATLVEFFGREEFYLYFECLDAVFTQKYGEASV